MMMILCLGTVAAGCTAFNKEEDYVPEDPADKLYNEGLFLLNNKQDYEGAAKKFDEVDRQNPYSDWARKALLMSAFSYTELEEPVRRPRGHAELGGFAVAAYGPGIS